MNKNSFNFRKFSHQQKQEGKYIQAESGNQPNRGRKWLLAKSFSNLGSGVLMC